MKNVFLSFLAIIANLLLLIVMFVCVVIAVPVNWAFNTAEDFSNKIEKKFPHLFTAKNKNKNASMWR